LGDRESAILAALPSGPYTAIVRGKQNTTGTGLVGIFQLPERSVTDRFVPGF